MFKNRFASSKRAVVKTRHRSRDAFAILESRKLKDATLAEYALARRSSDNDSHREVAIRAFFKGKVYLESAYHGIYTYQHHKIQWVYSTFFKEKGYTLVRETNFGYTDEVPPERIDMEYEDGKNMPIFHKVVQFYERGKEKLVIYINFADHQESYTYKMYHSKDTPTPWTDLNKMADDRNLYRGKKIDASCRFLRLNNNSWDDVILKPLTKQTIMSNIDGLLKNRDVLKRFGIPLKRGIILYGPPGTGKTQACRAIAKQSECSILYVLPRDFDPQKGGVRKIAEMAKDLAPCMLFIEDIDFIAKDRRLGEAGAVIELMNYLDGLEEFGDVITVGTTNHLEIIEDAIKNRPGRFDRVIKIGKPEKAEREAMIRRFTMKYDITDVDVSGTLSKLSKATDDLSGAHIKDLCNTAAANAAIGGSLRVEDGKEILVLKKKHFLDAIKEVSSKDYSSYQEQQSSGKGFGFGAKSDSLDDIFSDDL